MEGAEGPMDEGRVPQQRTTRTREEADSKDGYLPISQSKRKSKTRSHSKGKNRKRKGTSKQASSGRDKVSNSALLAAMTDQTRALQQQPVVILQRMFLDWAPCFSQLWPGFSFPRILLCDPI